MRAGAILAALLGLLGAPLAAVAQPMDGMVRIGFLAVGPAPLLESFREELRTYGHVEGPRLAIEWRFTEGQLERLPALVSDLVELNVALIVAPNTRPPTQPGARPRRYPSSWRVWAMPSRKGSSRPWLDQAGT